MFDSARKNLAFGWSIVTLLTVVAFVTAFLFTMESTELAEDYYNEENRNNWNDDNNNNSNGSGGTDVSVTTRALAFTACWTAALALVMAFVGTVVLGITSPTGTYYWCCAGAVHRTTPLSLGTFIGSLLMFANLTLVCAVLFSEFKIRDRMYRGGDGDGEGERDQEIAVERSSSAFAIMCVFLTLLYGSFAALAYTNSEKLLEENATDMRKEGGMSQVFASDPSGDAPAGYIGGERFAPTRKSSPSPLSGGFLKPEMSDSGEMT